GARPLGADHVGGSGREERVGDQSVGDPAGPGASLHPCYPEHPPLRYPASHHRAWLASLARGVCAPAETAVALDALVRCEHSGQRQPSDYPAVHRKAIQDVSALKTTVSVRLYPTPDQGAILHAHGQEYINTVNVLVHALDSDVLREAGQEASTKDFTAAL